jgi:hypothetical protein
VGISYSSKTPAYFLAEQSPTHISGVMALSVPAELKVENLELDPKHPSRMKSPMAAGSRVNEPVGVDVGTSVVEAGVDGPAGVEVGTVSGVEMFAELKVVGGERVEGLPVDD